MIPGSNLKLAGMGQGKDGQTSVRVSTLWTDNELRAFRKQGDFCYRVVKFENVCTYLIMCVCVCMYVWMYVCTCMCVCT